MKYPLSSAFLVALLWLPHTLAVKVRAPKPGEASKNLLRNPGAELPPYSDGKEDTLISKIPGWKRQGSFSVTAYRNSIQVCSPVWGILIPCYATKSRIKGGYQMFYGGPKKQNTSAYQVADVSKYAAKIDGGKVKARLSGFLGGSQDSKDYMTVFATFLDARNIPLGRFKIGPVTDKDRGGQTDSIARARLRRVPRKTRKVKVLLKATALPNPNDSHNLAFADNIAITLHF